MSGRDFKAKKSPCKAGIGEGRRRRIESGQKKEPD
jgi:hypothetical protein